MLQLFVLRMVPNLLLLSKSLMHIIMELNGVATDGLQVDLLSILLNEEHGKHFKENLIQSEELHVVVQE
jgi:hypothetical protein